MCVRSAGSPDTPGVTEGWGRHAPAAGPSLEAFSARTTLLNPLPSLAKAANAAVLPASDHASAVTAEVAHLTCGEVTDRSGTDR